MGIWTSCIRWKANLEWICDGILMNQSRKCVVNVVGAIWCWSSLSHLNL